MMSNHSDPSSLWRSRFLDVLDSPIHFYDTGPARGVGGERPILFLGGNPLSVYSWRHVLPHVSGRGRLIAIDPIGMGRSGRPDIAYDFEDQVRYYRGFLDALAADLDCAELTDLVLVLQGWGAAVGLEDLMATPERACALALLEPVMRLPMLDDMSLARLFHTLEGERMVLEDNWFIETMLFSVLTRTPSAAEKQAFRAPFPTPESRRAILGWSRMAPIDDEFPGIRDVVERYLAWLERSTLPKILFHRASLDDPQALVTASVLEGLRATWGDFEDVDVGRSSLYLQEDRPHDVGRALNRWLAALSVEHRPFACRRPARHPQTHSQEQSMSAPSSPSPQATATAQPPAGGYPLDVIQRVVDRASRFLCYAAPSGPASVRRSDRGELIGARLDQEVHSLDVTLPTGGSPSLRARNRLRGPVGRLRGRLSVASWSERVLPTRTPQAVALDPRVSQRVALQDVEVEVDGGGSLQLFGTGRTLPMAVGGEPRLLLAASLTVLSGRGAFAGLTGFVSFGGEFDIARGGFVGSIYLRIIDPEGRLQAVVAPSAGEGRDLDGDFTYLIHQVTKGDRSVREPNWFSFAPDGSMRSINTPVFLREMTLRTELASGVSSHLHLGGLVARERGLGIPTEPALPEAGEELRPIAFQGFAEDIFMHEGEEVGCVHINWLEGNVIREQPPEIPGQPTRRFGFYGHLLRTTGDFAGTHGIVHGAGGGALDPPLDLSNQAFDNYYVMQLNDPDRQRRL